VSLPRPPTPGEGEERSAGTPCGPDGATFDPAIEVSFTLPEEWERHEPGSSPSVYNSQTGIWEPRHDGQLVTDGHRGGSTFHPDCGLYHARGGDCGDAAPLTDPTLTFGPVASATAVQQAGLPFSWLTGLAALAGVALLVRERKR
jgi:hypothetical protein